jgi:ferritin-like metal-binding protein YciE
MYRHSGNVGNLERWLSLAAGVGLTLASFGRRGFLGRTAIGATGLSLLARGATGHCAVKAALTGESSLREGLADQWSRAKAGLGMTAAKEIGSIEELYDAELEELRSAENQLSSLLVAELSGHLQNAELDRLLHGYGAELRSRTADLSRILTARGQDPRAHPDQAMRALIGETRKMMQVCSPAVRDAAVVASIQRLLHFKIAGYGAVATYAKLLGRVDEASRLAEFGDRDKAIDKRLTDIAQIAVNPAAEGYVSAGEPTGARPH